MNFFHTKPECSDEITVVGMTECQGEGFFQYPHARGTIFAYGLKDLKVQGCLFSGNDPGPVFSQAQRIGLLDAEGEAWGQV